MQFKVYLFLIYCIIFHIQHKFVTAIYGPTARLANDGEFPGLVSILRLFMNPTDIYHKCTGILVSTQDVLTADHCLRNTFTEGFKVLVGSTDLAQGIEFYPMFVLSYEHWILYRQRSLRLYDHDICLVKLLGNVPEELQLLPLGNIQSNLLYGLDADITGWGRITDGTLPSLLHTAVVKILTRRDCQKMLFILENIHYRIGDNILCSVGEPYAVLGDGDSGGSLTFHGTMVGINNAVIPAYNGTIQPVQINLHLNLRYYYEYIRDVISSFHMLV